MNLNHLLGALLQLLACIPGAIVMVWVKPFLHPLGDFGFLAAILLFVTIWVAIASTLVWLANRWFAK